MLCCIVLSNFAVARVCEQNCMLETHEVTRTYKLVLKPNGKGKINFPGKNK